jgi:hypothetical protein
MELPHQKITDINLIAHEALFLSKIHSVKNNFSAGCLEGELILYLSTLDCSLSILLKKEIFKTPWTFFQEI